MTPRGAELQFLLRMRDEASRVVRQAAQTMRQLGTSSRRTSEDVRAVNMRMTELNQSMEVINRTMSVFNRTVGSSLRTFSDYDQGMTIVRRVTDMSRQEIEAFSDQFDAMTDRLRAVPVSRLTDIAGQAAQLGIVGTDNILQFTETVAMLETSLVSLGDQAPKLIVRVLNATGEGVAGVERFGNVLVRMAKSASASESRIMNLTALIAQATSQLDLGSESLLALATAAADLNFMPELFGTSVSRSLTQLYEAALNNTQGMRTLTAMTGITADEFQRLIEVDPAMALIHFAEAMDAVMDDGRSMTQFLTMFNLQADENRRILGTMAQNTDLFRRRLAEARLEAELQIALNQEFAVTLEAFFAQTQAASNAWELFKKQFGAALAPAATVVLGILTDSLIGLRELLQAMPDWAQQIVAWSALAIPALIAVSVAVRAVITVFGILGGTTVFRALGMVTTAVYTLIAALVRLALVASRAAAALLLLGGRAVVGGIGAAAAAIAVWAGRLTRVIALVATLAGFGRIVAFIARAFALVGSAIAAVAAALGGIPVAVVAAIAAAIAAIGGAAYAVYQRWDQIRQDVMSGTRSWAGAIANALWDGIKDGLEWAKDGIQDFFSDGIGFSSDTDLVDQDQVRRALASVYDERFAMQDAIAQMIENGAPQEMIQRAQRELEQLTNRAIFLSDIIAHMQGMPLENASQAVQDLFAPNEEGTPGAPTRGDILDPRLNVDTGVLSRLSDENRAVIEDMDDYSQTLAEVEKQMVAIQQLWSLPPTDPFFAAMGLEPEEVEDYIRRLQGLAQFRLEDANPVNTRARELQEEIFLAEQVTANGRQQLEIEQQLIELERQRGALTEAERSRIAELMRTLFAAQREAAIANAEFDLSQQISSAQAYTQEQREQVEISNRLIELEREHGTLTAQQVSRIRTLMQLLFELERQNAFRARTEELNDQLALAQTIFRVERNELTIIQEINRYERENGTLRADQRVQLEGQLRALQNMRDITSTITGLDPRAGAYINYIDSLNTLNLALREGAITQEYYNYLVGQLEDRTNQALNPMQKEIETLRERYALMHLNAIGGELEGRVMQEVNQLREQGINLTQEQVAAVREMYRALEQLEQAQSSGFEGWANEIGDATSRILDMQSSLADNFSSTLVDAIYGAEDAWSAFFLNASKMFTQFFLETALQQFAEHMGNDIFGLIPGMPTEDSARTRVDAAYENLDSMLRNMQFGQVDMAANIVNLRGFAEGAFGNGQLGAMGTSGVPFTGDAAGLLQSILTGGAAGRADSITGLNAEFGNQLAAMVAEAQRQFGTDAVSINSAYRSPELQAQLWQDALARYGSPEEARRWVAPPGASSHNFGMAADLQYQSPEVQQWFHENAGRYGMDFRMGNEPWHIEPENARAQIDAFRAAGGTGTIPSAGDLNLTGLSGDMDALAAAQERLGEAARMADTDLTGVAGTFDTTGVAARGTGTDVRLMGTDAQLAGTQVSMAGQNTQMMGINATMATTGVGMAGRATTQLGNEAAAAAPRITQAANALNQAGSGLGGGMFAGFGSALLGFGLGLLGNALSGNSNKKTVTYDYETPNVAITKLHGGGVVGRDGLRKGIDYASAYFSAPKYHDGLQSNEFRAVLERGERVLTERDNQRVERVLERVASGEINRRDGGTVNMYVNTPDAGSFNQSRSSTMAKMQAGLSRAAARRG